MDLIGGEFGLRKRPLEINIQWMEIVDLEQNGNDREKIIHMMWKNECWVEKRVPAGKACAEKIGAGPERSGTP